MHYALCTLCLVLAPAPCALRLVLAPVPCTPVFPEVSQYYPNIPGTALVMRCFLAIEIAEKTRTLKQEPSVLQPSASETMGNRIDPLGSGQEGARKKLTFEEFMKRAAEPKAQPARSKAIQSCQECLDAFDAEYGDKKGGGGGGEGEIAPLRSLLSGFMNLMKVIDSKMQDKSAE